MLQSTAKLTQRGSAEPKLPQWLQLFYLVKINLKFHSPLQFQELEEFPTLPKFWKTRLCSEVVTSEKRRRIPWRSSPVTQGEGIRAFGSENSLKGWNSSILWQSLCAGWWYRTDPEPWRQHRGLALTSSHRLSSSVASSVNCAKTSDKNFSSSCVTHKRNTPYTEPLENNFHPYRSQPCSKSSSPSNLSQRDQCQSTHPWDLPRALFPLWAAAAAPGEQSQVKLSSVMVPKTATAKCQPRDSFSHVPSTLLTIKPLPLARALLCQAGKLYGLLLAFHIHILCYQEIFKYTQEHLTAYKAFQLPHEIKRYPKPRVNISISQEFRHFLPFDYYALFHIENSVCILSNSNVSVTF